MATILDKIEIAGIGLMSGIETRVSIEPSTETGITFYPDASNIPVKACLNNVISTQHCTVLGAGDKHVKVVEHFMAACALAGVDRLNVYLDSSELPILDGSAKNWVELFKKAGIKLSSNNSEIDFTQQIYYSEGKTNLLVFPSDRFTVSYCTNFNHPDLANRWYKWEVSNSHDEIIEARTFGYLKDLETFQKAGYALGARVDNIVGLTEYGYTTELRSDLEPIKHKILDLIGDLNLTGINPLRFNAHIIAQEAGHKSHIEFARIINQIVSRGNYATK